MKMYERSWTNFYKHIVLRGFFTQTGSTFWIPIRNPLILAIKVEEEALTA